MESVADRIVDCPARAPGNGDVRDALTSADVNDRHGERAGDAWIADMRDKKS
jgi:hypothetical protein